MTWAPAFSADDVAFSGLGGNSGSGSAVEFQANEGILLIQGGFKPAAALSGPGTICGHVRIQVSISDGATWNTLADFPCTIAFDSATVVGEICNVDIAFPFPWRPTIRAFQTDGVAAKNKGQFKPKYRAMISSVSAFGTDITEADAVGWVLVQAA